MGKSVFITGASSGIGLALAHEFAARGFALVLAARRLDSLNSLKQAIVARHPQCVVHLYALDVTRYADVFAVVNTAAQQIGALDIVIANAGIGSAGSVGDDRFEQHRAMIETNVIGAMATCDAAIKLFKSEGSGQLVVISSVAAFRGLPGSAPYSASKAAIATYAEAVRAETYGSNIKITVIYPGFIDTPINQNNPNRPFLITPERGAKLIADKIERGVQSAVIPAFPWVLVKWLAKAIPTSMLASRQR